MKLEDLRKHSQREKLKTNVGLTYHNRKLSIYLTYLCIKLGVSANQATVSGIFIGIIGSGLFIPGIWWLNIAGIFMLWLSFTLDQSDGELARYYGTVNLGGVYLDEIRHILIYSVTIFCLSFPFSEQFDSYLPLVLGFIGANVLILSRVEERLPYMIFVEKIILKHNFTYGELPSEEGEAPTCAGASVIQETSYVKSNLKKISRLVYAAFAFMADQGGILVTLLSVTVIDVLLNDGSLAGVALPAQLGFLVFFSIVGLLLEVRTIQGHWRDAWAEQECRKIMVECKKMVCA